MYSVHPADNLQSDETFVSDFFYFKNEHTCDDLPIAKLS